MKITLKILFALIIWPFSLHATEAVVDSIQSPKLYLTSQYKVGKKLLKDDQQFDKAVQLFQNIHSFAESKNLSNQFPEISIGYGIAMYKNGDIQNAYSILLESLPQIDDNDSKLKAEANQILGMTLVFQSKFSEGYKYQIDALTYYSDLNDSTGLMSVYYDLGANFSSQGQSELALQNYEKGIELAKALKDAKKTILGITAIGGTWAALNNFEKALTYSEESIELAYLLKDDEELAWASINRGHILGQLKKYPESEYYLEQAYNLSFKIGNKLLTAYSLEQMSDINFKQDLLDAAIKDLDESYTFYQELGQLNSLKGLTKKYAEIYYKQKNFAKYKEYTDQYMALKDSLYSKEMMEEMANLKQDFQIHQIERENQIALLTKDQEIAVAKNFTHLAITCSAILIFVLLLILMISRNKAAVEKNELLSAKNAEILRQNEFLVNSNRDLEKFAYIISHDLKEPLRNINGFTKLLIRKMTKYTDDKDITEYAGFITKSTEQMAQLLNGLLEYSKLNANKKDKKESNLGNIVLNVMDSLRIQLKEKNCEIELKSLPSIPCRTTQLSQVFQNLIANAIKFGPDTGNKIIIGAQDLGNKYRIYVKDHGIGIDEEYRKDIFEVFKRLHDRGTYSGSGIGLATCKKIVEDHGGRIWVESKKGEGACFYFTLPKQAIPEIASLSKETEAQQTQKRVVEHSF